MDHDVRGIANWVPVFVFAFLFGISMDYQVFLTERIRELRQGGARNGDAVRGGLRGTGRIIVTAALIMVVAFGGFAMGTRHRDEGVRLRAGGRGRHRRPPHPLPHRPGDPRHGR